MIFTLFTVVLLLSVVTGAAIGVIGTEINRYGSYRECLTGPDDELLTQPAAWNSRSVLILAGIGFAR